MYGSVLEIRADLMGLCNARLHLWTSDDKDVNRVAWHLMGKKHPCGRCGEPCYEILEHYSDVALGNVKSWADALEKDWAEAYREAKDFVALHRAAHALNQDGAPAWTPVEADRMGVS